MNGSATTESWRPLLTADLARRAGEAAAAIAAAVRAGPRDPLVEANAADLALFLGYFARARGSAADEELAIALLGRAVARAPALTRLGLFGGLCGLGWTVQHLQGPPVGLAIDAREVVDTIDAVLLEALRRPAWPGEVDRVDGLASFGVYFLARLPAPAAAEGLRLVVSHLAALAEAGATWFTLAERVPAHQRPLAPRGYYNLGTAHGVPGIIGLLAAAHARGVAREACAALLGGAVPWVLAQATGGPELVVPRWVGPGVAPAPARVAWCYGDLGVSLQLLRAAGALGRADWTRAALELAAGAARVPDERAGAVDACLCHGTAGNGHLFDRLFRATGEPAFRAAAERYFARTLDDRGPAPAWASFWTSPPGSTSAGWGPDASFLAGAAGVGLALLAASSPLPPAWDSLLLVEI
jgi:cytochrome c553